MSYLFPIANSTDLGVVSAGTNITITNGVVSSAGGSSATTGTWTPFVDTTGSGVYAVLVKYATYSKIGQQVTCYFDISVTSLSGGSNSDYVIITGLPFVSATTVAGYVGSLYTSYIANISGGTFAGPVTGTISSSTSTVVLWDTSGTSTRLKQECFKLNSEIAGTIQYLSAS